MLFLISFWFTASLRLSAGGIWTKTGGRWDQILFLNSNCLCAYTLLDNKISGLIIAVYTLLYSYAPRTAIPVGSPTSMKLILKYIQI